MSEEAIVIPGEVKYGAGTIRLNERLSTVTLVVENSGDRPVQVGSHFEFSQVNEALIFDRAITIGTRLDIPSGTAIRFEPGVSRTVQLVAFSGTGRVPGLQIRDTDHDTKGEPRD